MKTQNKFNVLRFNPVAVPAFIIKHSAHRTMPKQFNNEGHAGSLELKRVLAEEVGTTVLFHIERSCDKQIVVYKALREGKFLIDPYVHMFWSRSDDVKVKETISDIPKSLIFGAEVKTTESIAVYDMCLAALKQRKITLHVKKKGGVTAKTTFRTKDSTEEATISYMYIDMSIGLFNVIPDIKSVTIFGVRNKTKKEVSETIYITEEMKTSFTNLFKESMTNFVF